MDPCPWLELSLELIDESGDKKLLLVADGDTNILQWKSGAILSCLEDEYDLSPDSGTVCTIGSSSVTVTPVAVWLRW